MSFFFSEPDTGLSSMRLGAFGTLADRTDSPDGARCEMRATVGHIAGGPSHRAFRTKRVLVAMLSAALFVLTCLGETTADTSFLRLARLMTVSSASAAEANPGALDASTADITTAIALILEIERNEAAAMQKRSKPMLYRLTPTHTLFDNGVVYLAQEVGANNVLYATVYCAFNETQVDARRIVVGVQATYSAVLYDVTRSQRYADSGFAAGVINYKDITLSSCEIVE